MCPVSLAPRWSLGKCWEEGGVDAWNCPGMLQEMLQELSEHSLDRAGLLCRENGSSNNGMIPGDVRAGGNGWSQCMHRAAACVTGWFPPLLLLMAAVHVLPCNKTCTKPALQKKPSCSFHLPSEGMAASGPQSSLQDWQRFLEAEPLNPLLLLPVPIWNGRAWGLQSFTLTTTSYFNNSTTPLLSKPTLINGRPLGFNP